ncbi:MAG: tetratricopeptide repeat protein [Phycisphaerae bacterium]|nr:tetratricopeptide repeat protein [Phycisphaerae bacterium]
MARAEPIDETAATTSPAARWSAIAIAVIAVARMVVAIQPQVRFDTDPAINPDPFVGLGPAASLVLDVMLLVAAATGLAACARGRGVRGWLVACAIVPAIPVLFHGTVDAVALFRGATWLAGAVACVAVAHLSRDSSLRRLFLAAMIAAVVPLLVRGAEQATFEHQDTVAAFRARQTEFFAERGWAPDGPAAKGFIRRLEQLEAVGWFGLANLFSCVMAFGTLALGGLAVASFRRVEQKGLPALLALGAIACAGFLILNGSKGAIGATALGAGVGLVAWRWPSRAGLVACAALLVAACAPALRGLLPEDFAGEKSLLFRSQYLAGALAMLPQSLPFGIGPNSFQAAYMLVKPARSPEDVVSAHAMAIDWLVMLGPLALAWVALVVRGVAGRAPTADLSDDDANEPSIAPVAVILAAAVFALQGYAEHAAMDTWWLIARTVSAMGFGLAFVLVYGTLGVLGPRGAYVAVLAAVVAVVAHAQLEMVLFQPGTVIWAFVALGAVMGFTLDAGVAGAPATSSRRAAWIGSALALLAAGAVTMIGVIPQLRQDALFDEAAAVVAPIAEIRGSWPTAAKELAANQPGIGTQQLVATVTDAGGVEMAAQLKAAIASGSDAPTRVAAVVRVLRRFDADRRAKAADLLQAADAAYPQNSTALEAAIKQLAAAGRRTVGPRRTEVVEPMLHRVAIDLAARGAERTRMPLAGARFHAMLADLLLELARGEPNDDTTRLAIAAVEAAIERQPRVPRLYVDLGDLHQLRGDRAKAIEAYQRALAIDADLALDPLVQFGEAQRRELESRISAGSASAPSS